MYALTLLQLGAFLLAVLLTPVCRAAALRLGYVDRPDKERKKHASPTARIGGVAVVASALGACGLMLGASGLLPPAMQPRLDLFASLLPPALVMFAIGLLDDLVNLKPLQKLLGQVGAAGLAWRCGVHLWTPPGWPPLVDALATMFWLVLCANAVNLIDGIDGLAAGTSSVTALALMGGAILHGDLALAFPLAALAGATAGFFAYNFSPASVFLGDSGSLTIGFLLGCYGALWAGNLPAVLGGPALVLVLILPLADTGFAIVRRLVRGQRIFDADRGHIHHRLLDRGFSASSVTVLLCGYSALCAGCALLIAATGDAWWLLGPALVAVAGFDLPRPGRRAGLPGSLTFSMVQDAHRALRALGSEAATFATPEECWRRLAEVARQHRIPQVRLELNGVVYEKRAEGMNEKDCWVLEIPIANEGFIRASAPFDGSDEPAPAELGEGASIHRFQPKARSRSAGAAG